MTDLLVANWADAWLENLCRASWQGALVIGAVATVQRFWTNLSPRIICWLWRLACLKMLVTLFWIEPVAIPLLPYNALHTISMQQGTIPVTSGIAKEHVPEAPQALPSLRPASLAIVLLPFWLLGVLCGSLMFARQWRSIGRVCARGLPSENSGLEQIYRQEARRLALRQVPLLCVSSGANGPFLAGAIRSIIVLPSDAEQAFDAGELRLILAHELAHYKRRDLLWNWLLAAAGVLFFFHPLVWLLWRRWSEAQEAACDELVLQSRHASVAEYGQLILKLSVTLSSQPRASLASADGLGAYLNLERRITAMTHVRPFHLGRLLLAAALLALLALPGIVPWTLAAADPDPAAARQQAIDQMKHLGIALMNYHDVHKSLPRPAITDKDGKPLLSWRVAILPFIDRNLYDQFHLDEAWDSDHNKTLIAKMPDAFRCPNSKKAGNGMTVYVVPRGPSTAFPGNETISIRQIIDGTSKTIAIVEADEDHAVPWTKPEDWQFSPEKPTEGLGGHVGDLILATYVDAHVTPIPKSIAPKTMRELITRNGREPIPAPY